ncbi:MAG: hypothetical protein EXS35_04110 [Pedosphaera sp.]|nr:hypothetical protein [Pedosphaera sp.]
MPANDFTHDVFLSHSSKDKAVVRASATGSAGIPAGENLYGQHADKDAGAPRLLRADGLRGWLDVWEIRPGDSIPAKIEEGLENVTCAALGAMTDAELNF